MLAIPSMKKIITDPAELLPFSKYIIIDPDDIIPKDPIPNELTVMGTLKQVQRKKTLLFID